MEEIDIAISDSITNSSNQIKFKNIEYLASCLTDDFNEQLQIF